MKRLPAVIYGIVAYVVFFVSFVYAIGFVANVAVPKGIDDGEVGPMGTALVVDLLLLTLFAVQHSVMARPAFKRWWTTFVPEPVERSTYVLASSLVLLLLYWQWRPMPDLVWQVSGIGAALLWVAFAAGWAIVLLSTLMIGHFDLFGLAQVYRYLRDLKPTDSRFITPGFYKLVRHPIMTGFIVAFWATPEMSVGHLLFAVVTTVYIVVALQLEERDLIGEFGERYRKYRKEVPILFPSFRKRVGKGREKRSS